jgi:hypothetical protein
VRSCNGFVCLSAAAALTSYVVRIELSAVRSRLLEDPSPPPSPQSVRPRQAQARVATQEGWSEQRASSLLRSSLAAWQFLPIICPSESFVASSFLLNVEQPTACLLHYSQFQHRPSKTAGRRALTTGPTISYSPHNPEEQWSSL